MSDWAKVRDFFRQIDTGDFVTRNMYMDVMKAEGIKETLLDNYRCYLQRAGYIFDKKYEFRNRGVYFMAKRIPATLTLPQVEEQAYGKRVKITPIPMIEYETSEDLRQLLGLRYTTKNELYKHIWAFIRQNEMQDVNNKRMILAGKNELFQKIMGGQLRISMFVMANLINKHLKERKR